MSSQVPGSRRRVAVPRERSVSSLTLLAFVLPLLTVGALALVRPPEVRVDERTPDAAPLTRTSVVCPAPGPGSGPGQVLLGVPDADASGELTLRRPDGTAALAEGQVRSVPAPGDPSRPLIIQAGEELAAGLTGARTWPGASVTCQAPVPEAWFTAVGAGAEQRSVLRLVNPDGGAAVADVTVWAGDGQVEADALTGVVVRGLRGVDLDLADLVPRRDDLTIRVQVPRGRLSVFLLHQYDEIGSDTSDRDWSSPVDSPATTIYLAGVRRGSGTRELVVGNPGEDQTRVTLRLATARSELAPGEAPEITVPPGSTLTVPVGDLLGAEVAEGTLALRLDSDHPVVATVREVLEDGVRLVPGGPVLDGPAGSVVPPGPASLVLTGATEETTVRLALRAADGTPLRPREIELSPGVARDVTLPPRVAWVSLDPRGIGIRATLQVGGPAGPVLPLSASALDRQVPHVRSGLY